MLFRFFLGLDLFLEIVHVGRDFLKLARWCVHVRVPQHLALYPAAVPLRLTRLPPLDRIFVTQNIFRSGEL